MKQLTFLFSACVMFSGTTFAELQGSYAYSKPAGITDPPAPSVSPQYTGPIPTTDWCSSLVFSDSSESMFPHPLAFDCNRNGLEMGYPATTTVQPDYFFTPFQRDIKISLDGMLPTDVILDNHSDWAVTASWDGGRIKATMAHGSPFCFFTAKYPISCSFPVQPTVWYNENGTLGISIGNRHYGLFAPSGSEWAVPASSAFTSSLAGKTYFSIAALPDATEATLTYFRQFAFNEIIDTKVSWLYNQLESTVETQYTAIFTAHEGTETNLLFALYPHQWMHVNQPVTEYRFNSIRGEMKVLEGASFSTSHPFHGILPHLPLSAVASSGGYQQTTLAQYIQDEAAKTASALVRAEGDSYWTGKDLGRTAQLVRIADQIGNTQARDYFLTVMKEKLEDWFTYTSNEASEFFYYNSTWGTLIGVNPSYDSDKSINDHHFHYGYFVYAAATVAQFDKAWALEWKNSVDEIIRDCDSPFRDDADFPFLRAFDVYAGHSWASGNALFASGNNQESSSEAVNFAAGTALWGMATGDTTMRDLGIYLYTHETCATLNYWFDIHNITFPTDYALLMVGIIWGDKAAHETWFSAEPECIHGINVLPVTAASLYLARSVEYAQQNFNEVVSESGGTFDPWFDIMTEYQALSAPSEALGQLINYPAFTPEDGETRAHVYHWVANLTSLGLLDTIRANTASYSVFENNGKKTYIVWNPEDQSETVTFSDGKSCIVPSQTLKAFSEDEMLSTTLPGVQSSQTKPVFQVVNEANRLSITVPQQVNPSVKTVCFYATNGKLIATYPLTHGSFNGQVHIPLSQSSLPPGMYVVRTGEFSGKLLLMQ